MPIISPSAVSYWQPLLDPEEAHAARTSVNEIAAALIHHLRDQQQSAKWKPYLGEGAAGIAIFFAYLCAAGFFEEQSLALEYLNISTDAVASQVMQPSLFSGFSGIAWAALHISDVLGHSPDDSDEEIDGALEIYLGRSPWEGDYDLINGLAGLGVYFLERRGSPLAVHCLELIVERLGELAQSGNDEVHWFTVPQLLPETQRQMFPGGYYNLGLAHGVPGIIALLSKIVAAGIAPTQAGRLLRGAVNWLLRQRLWDGSGSSFSAFAVPGGTAEGCRLAWCYGDAGIATALLLAARCTGTETWETEALKIARRAALRDPESCGVVDACFCHGSAGLAHIFNRLYRATRDELSAEAARFWVQRTLQFRNPSAGAASYRTLCLNDAGEMEFQERFGLIEGIAGTGLSLLATITNLEPLWDRVFLVDIPPITNLV